LVRIGFFRPDPVFSGNSKSTQKTAIFSIVITPSNRAGPVQSNGRRNEMRILKKMQAVATVLAVWLTLWECVPGWAVELVLALL
jgi:hypothetical protein